MNTEILKSTVQKLTAPPKGILAADESAPTCNARFEKLGIATTEEKRREYRELLITAPRAEQYISGVILFDETIRQKTKDGASFPKFMQEHGIEVGIKVDQGTKDFEGHPSEKYTDGLAGLPERLKEYHAMGASFAKWRAVYTIGEATPSEDLMKKNAEGLAQYALDCQNADIVPIVEPEVLLDGTHSIEKCYEVMARNFQVIFAEIKNKGVYLPGLILKTSMVLSGKEATNRADVEQVAQMTVKCLKENVPADLGAVVFLSGGQSEEEATLHLNAMNKIPNLPWRLTFSYSRAIQAPVLKYWAENPLQISEAQAILLKMAKQNSDASIGKYIS